MSRTYAKVYVSIWSDDDFKALTPPAQALYWRLLTDPKISMCGVADWRPNRLALSAKGVTPKMIQVAGTELESARFVLIDEEAEEVLVRSFVRHDGVLKSPNLVKAMVSDWTAVSSSRLQSAVVIEVQRAMEMEPEMKGLHELPERFHGHEVELDPKGSVLVPDEFPEGSPILQPATNNLQPSSSSEIASDLDATPRPEVLELCEHLAAKVATNGHKTPKTMGKQWFRPCRLLLDVDGRSVKQVRDAIDWATTDPFWSTNIRSMATLREKYSTLQGQAQMQRPSKPVQLVREYTPTPEVEPDWDELAGIVVPS